MVETRDNRINFLAGEENYKFIDIESGPVWIGESERVYPRYYTNDGINYDIEVVSQLFGAYFFYSKEKIEHSRDVMGFAGVFAEVGGLYSLVYLIFGSVGHYINEKLKMAKFIRSLYFVCETENEIPQVKNI